MGGIQGLAQALCSSLREGIGADAQAKHAAAFGANLRPVHKPQSIFSIILDALGDRILQILIIAALVSLIVGSIEDPQAGWMEGTAILVAVVIIVSVTSGNEYIKQKQFIKLNAQADEVNVTVTRSGKESDISVYELVVGDVVAVRCGDILPVDGVLVKANKMAADESSITGESELVKKTAEKSPFLISGSKIAEGNGMMLVTAVGTHSILGKSRAILEDTEEEQTPLQEKLEVVADDIGKVGTGAGLFTFIALLIYDIYDAYQNWEWGSHNTDALINAFIIMVTVIVVAVPEGLPLAVTISLAYSVGKMKEENNFVRHLHACETMGGANNICSDKTGTLTENKMTVTDVYAGGQILVRPQAKDLSDAMRNAFIESICCNSTAFFAIDPTGKKVASGNMTECAMLILCDSWGVKYSDVRSPDKEVSQFPFSSSTKRMTTVIKSEGGMKVLTKGAAEMVLTLCSSIMLPDGKVVDMTSEHIATIQATIKNFANRALRAISLAYKPLDQSVAEDFHGEDGPPQEDIEKDLIFLGMVGIQDPIRKEVPEAVAVAHKAGVTVRMVTGDNLETAVAIAKDCGIIPADYIPDKNDYVVLTGVDFRTLVGGLVAVDKDSSSSGSAKSDKKSKKSDKEGSKKEDEKKEVVHKVGNLEMFTEIAARLRVLARSSPEDKFLLVTGLKQLGNVVAVTGDGSNDAPALKKSDVGLAMNITGTALAKDASDIILIDDNFASIITAIKWGRNIYDCIRKFLQFQLTVNAVALFMVFLGAVVIEQSPLTAIQMLWVNLIMDTLAALALATAKPDIAVLNKTPYSRDEYIVTADMAVLICGTGLFQMAWLLVILFLGPSMFSIEASWGHTQWTEENGRHFTIFFNIFVFLQVFNEINATKLLNSEFNVFKGILSNGLYVAIMIGTVVIQIVLVQFGG